MALTGTLIDYFSYLCVPIAGLRRPMAGFSNPTLLNLMPYTRTVTRKNRTAFVILLDRSGSMAEKITFDGRCMSKAEALASVTNRLIFELLCRSRRSDGIRDYFDLALMGYSGDKLHSIISGADGFVPISQFALLGAASEANGSEFAPEKWYPTSNSMLPRWVSPAAEGSTPMFEALLEACEITERWCARPENADSYPPTIFNITDGEASDADEADLCEICDRIRSLSTRDGNVLLFNIHLATSPTERQIIFPASKEELGQNRYARLLYDCASTMPETYSRYIATLRNDPVPAQYRGMSFNAAIHHVATMMNIGSISLNVM